MEIRVLKYFLMAAREENITKAAKLLHLTQPTLSRQLMQLEEELGVKLFHRSKHRIILTEDGLFLRRRAEEIVSLSEKTIEDFLHKKNHLSGRITVGSGEWQSSRFLAELISAFQTKNPEVYFELYSSSSDNIKERIDRGSLDFGLLQEPIDISKYDFIRTPVRETWGILTSRNSSLASREYVTPRDLTDMPLILPQRESLQKEVFNWFGSYRKKLKIAATGNLLYNMAILARERKACVITLNLDCSYEGLCFVPLFPPMEAGTVLVWKKAQVFSPASSEFISYLRKYISGINNDII
ncbi:MAG: LysR family transcriptional regulator [Ruminococcus sp.]|jgi:DNA-binding transcriptional LysR family regulator